jgi:ectoine hydroxylase-related dioxygenase (phytanoyl-CoA dioxygenase family)
MSIHQLSDDQINQYRSEGYVVAPSLIDTEMLQDAYDAIEALTLKALAMDDPRSLLEFEPVPVDGKPTPRRIYMPFQTHEAFRAIAVNDAVLDRIEQLIGPDIHCQHSKLNMKPAKVGSVVEWHQDLTYFPHTNDDLVTTLVYLDDATEENGCLQVLPRMHDRYLHHDRADGTFAGMVTEDLKPYLPSATPLPAPAGSVIFMHCLTPHSSLPNLSTKSRRTLIFEYRAADSLPLYFGEGTVRSEAGAVLVRGKPARFARFGKIQPLIPQVSGFTSSLYDLQAKSKAASLAGS